MTSDSKTSSTPSPKARLVTPAEADQLAPGVASAIRAINNIFAKSNPPLTNGEIVTVLFNVLATNIVMSETLVEIEGGRPYDPTNAIHLAERAASLFVTATTTMAEHEAKERPIFKHLSLSLSPTAGNA